MITISGREILKDGAPLKIRGINYSNIPIGGSEGAAFTKQPNQLRLDLIDIRQAGFNVIKVYYDDYNAQEYETALDLCTANGIDVIMLCFLTYNLDYSVATGGANRTEAITKVTTMVNNLKDHPAIIGWGVGNEQNYNLNTTTAPDWYSLLDDAIEAGKAIDSTRFYTTANGEISDLSKYSGLVPNIDVWGVNIYRGTTFSRLKQQAIWTTTKPILLTEYGFDRYNSDTPAEDEPGQASRVIALAKEAESYYPVIAGHILFQYADGWWKAGNPSEHDTTSTPATWDDRDQEKSEEYFGITEATADGSSTTRPKKQAYDDLKALYTTTGYSSAILRSRTNV